MEGTQFSYYTEQPLIYARLCPFSEPGTQWAHEESLYFSSILSKSNCVTTDLIDLPSLLRQRPTPSSKFNSGAPDYSGFAFYPSNSSEPLLLFDRNGNPAAARIPINDLIQSLESGIKNLPFRLTAGKSIAARGGFRVFTYGVHADYNPIPRYNVDYVSHQPASSSFISDDLRPVVEVLSRWYRFLHPDKWAKEQGIVLPDGLEARAKPWTTLTINVPVFHRAEDGPRSVMNKPHVDILDHKSSMTGVIPYRWDGNWEKGKVVLFPLKTVLEVGRGEAYLMFGAIMHHGNLPDSEGGRGSLVCHSRESIHSWWHKQQAVTVDAAERAGG